jgi:hypothetical protein
VIPRSFTWAPASATELRGAFDCADTRSVVLVPLEVGTAIVATKPIRLRDVIWLAEEAREKISAPAMSFLWDDKAACIYPVSRSLAPGWDWGSNEARFNLAVRPDRFNPVTRALLRAIDHLNTPRSWRGKQVRAARRIANALQAPEDIVLDHVRKWSRGHGVVIELLESTGKSDLARIARQIESGSFDRWRDAEDLPIVPLVND